MIAGLPVWVALACIGVVLVGATVQATLGIGMGMIASPVLALADHDFIPGAIVISVVPLSLAVATREHAAIDRRGVGVALVGRVPGVVLGTVAVAVSGDRALALLVAVSVLGAVAVSLTSVHVHTSSPTLFGAGVASGFMGTATGVGGPPMALTYQHSDPSVMRASLATFFTVGAVMSIVGLMASGEIGARQWELSLLLLPGVAVGFVLSQVASARLRRDGVRPLVLTLCAASAIVLLAEELW